MQYVKNINKCINFVHARNFFKMKFVLVFFGVFGSISAVELPSYIKPCSLKDPNINECIKNEANAVIPTVVKGDPQLAIPVLSPLTLPQLDVGGSNLQIRLTNLQNDDLKKLRFREALFDLSKQKAGFVGFIDSVTILATYSIKNGKIRSRTVSGSGKFNMTLVSNIIDYKCGVAVKETDGAEYLYTIDPTVDVKIERAYYQFENLRSSSGGDIDEYIDKNWRWLREELKPSINKFFTEFLDSTLNRFTSHVPINKMFRM